MRHSQPPQRSSLTGWLELDRAWQWPAPVLALGVYAGAATLYTKYALNAVAFPLLATMLFGALHVALGLVLGRRWLPAAVLGALVISPFAAYATADCSSSFFADCENVAAEAMLILELLVGVPLILVGLLLLALTTGRRTRRRPLI